jgi:hypothetical protein
MVGARACERSQIGQSVFRITVPGHGDRRLRANLGKRERAAIVVEARISHGRWGIVAQGA